MADFTIKRNDLLPILEAILKDSDNNPVDLSNAVSVAFHMREEEGGALKIEDGNAPIDANPETGKVSYTWVTTDTDTSGVFFCEFEVTWAGSKIQTFPSRGYVSVQILDDLS